VDIFKKTGKGSWSKVKTMNWEKKEQWLTLLDEKEAGDATEVKFEITENHSSGCNSQVCMVGGFCTTSIKAINDEGKIILGASAEDLKKQKEKEKEKTSTPKTDMRSLKVGDKVKVKKSIGTPKYKWGSIDHSMVGTLKSITGTDARVDFTKQSNWMSLLSELERAD